MFDIYFTGESAPQVYPGVKAALGRIQIEDFQETFSTGLMFWSPQRYERHWVQSLQRLVDGSASTALVTSFVKPSAGGWLNWWVLYREDHAVYLQDEMLFFDDLKTPFVEHRPWESIRPRSTVTESGLPVSEWKTSLSSITECLQRKAQGLNPFGG
jgi:hypothetical protein